MDTEETSHGQKIPIAIHFIALFYIVHAIFIFFVFLGTRKYVSPSLIGIDIITISLLLIPLVAIWSIYKPNRFLRWFPLYTILLNWVIIFGILYLLDIIWLDSALKKPNEESSYLDAMIMIVILDIMTIWLLIPAIILYAYRTTRIFILQKSSSIERKLKR